MIGAIPITTMNIAIVTLMIVSVVLRSLASCGTEGKKMDDAIAILISKAQITRGV